MTVGATGSAAKQAFDSIVQRDAPDANRGRSFARFETRFQLVWVIGALIPIVIPIPAASASPSSASWPSPRWSPTGSGCGASARARCR